MNRIDLVGKLRVLPCYYGQKQPINAKRTETHTHKHTGSVHPEKTSETGVSVGLQTGLMFSNFFWKKKKILIFLDR